MSTRAEGRVVGLFMTIRRREEEGQLGNELCYLLTLFVAVVREA